MPLHLVHGTPTFATQTELAVAVAANGGQSLGPSVSVAGVLWVWDPVLLMYIRSGSAKQVPASGTIALLGSSLTNYQAITVNGNTVLTGRAWGAWLKNAGNSNRYTWLIYGYPSQGTDVIRSHLEEVIAAKPDVIVLEYGMNSAFTEADGRDDAEKIKADMLKVYSYGIVPVAVGMHVRDDAFPNKPAACVQNNIISEWCMEKGFAFISAGYALANKTSKHGNTGNVFLADQLHWSPYGAMKIGLEASNAFSGSLNWHIFPWGNAETSSEVMTNPRFTGSAAVSETGFSGTKCSDITLQRVSGSGTGVVSVGEDGNGAYMDISYTFGNGGEQYQISEAALSTRWIAPSYRMYHDFEIISGSVVKSVCATAKFTGTAIQHPYPYAGSDYNILPVGRYIMRSDRIYPSRTGGTNPAYANTLLVTSMSSGTSVIRFRGFSVREAVD